MRQNKLLWLYSAPSPPSPSLQSQGWRLLSSVPGIKRCRQPPPPLTVVLGAWCWNRLGGDIEESLLRREPFVPSPLLNVANPLTPPSTPLKSQPRSGFSPFPGRLSSFHPFMLQKKAFFKIFLMNHFRWVFFSAT